MRAVVCTAYGPPGVLELRDVERPVPRDHEVPIKVCTTTAHRGDVRIRSFDVPRGQRLMARLVLGFTQPKNPILGIELAGVVERAARTSRTRLLSRLPSLMLVLAFAAQAPLVRGTTAVVSRP